VFDCSLPLAADRAEEVALSSLADEKRVGSLLRNTARRWGWGSLRSRSLFGHGGARSGASDDKVGGTMRAMREQL
jgi:hypothetical protein